MIDAQAIIYLSIFLMALLFTLLSFFRESYAERGMFAFLSFVSWLIFGYVHILVSVTLGLESIGYLFFGFSFVFLVAGIAYTVHSIKDAAQKEQDKQFEVNW